MKRILIIILITLCAINLIGIIYLYTEEQGNENIYYVDTIELFNNFIYKQELEQKFISVKNARQHILDSLNIELKGIVNGYETATVETEKIRLEQSYKTLLKIIDLKSKQFEEENYTLNNQYDQQVWNQLNSYVAEYGKERKMKIILGAIGNGSLMYAEDQIDITNELTEYVNNKYQGF